MKRAVFILILLSSCSSLKDRDYPRHVSDPESLPCIKGVTYDKGPVHPTFWETVFSRLGIR